MALNNISNVANNSNATSTNANNGAVSNSNNETLNSGLNSGSAANNGAAVAVNNTAIVNDNVVRIDENSDDNLQALFDIALNQKARPLQVPFRMRNLPDSFFNPPSTGSKSPSVSHTRENSVDSAFGSGTTTICSPNGGNSNTSTTGTNSGASTTPVINPLASRIAVQISHSRAHSSPASLQQTYAGLNTQNNTTPIVASQATAAVTQQVTKGFLNFYFFSFFPSDFLLLKVSSHCFTCLLRNCFSFTSLRMS